MSNNEDKTMISKYTLESILLHFSATIKRLIITTVILIILWFLTVAGFIVYLSLPEEEYSAVTQTAEDINSSNINQKVGEP